MRVAGGSGGTSSCLRKQRNTPTTLENATTKPNANQTQKIDLVRGMMDCLYAEATPIVTDCVMAELEKLGQKYRVALRVAKDPRVERLPCAHKGTYADDCLCERVRQHKCYIVATCDRDLRRRIRKVRRVCWVCVGECVRLLGVCLFAFYMDED
jgi:rRNA-processing protein FCF1